MLPNFKLDLMLLSWNFGQNASQRLYIDLFLPTLGFPSTESLSNSLDNLKNCLNYEVFLKSRKWFK